MQYSAYATLLEIIHLSLNHIKKKEFNNKLLLKMAALISYSRETFFLIYYYGYRYEILENNYKQTLFLVKTAVTRNCCIYSSGITF